MNQQRPTICPQESWDALNRAKSIITEHFPNVAIFVNWVCDEGQTRHGEILDGNAFALRHHIEKYLDGEFLEEDLEDQAGDHEAQNA